MKTRRLTIDANFYKKYGILLVLVVMWAIMFCVSPTFRSLNNVINIFRQVSIKGIIAVGMTFVILICGIDLTVGSQVAVAGVFTGSILVAFPGNDTMVVVACLAGILVCGLLGLVNGLFIAHAKVPPFIATIAAMTIARGIAYVYSNGQPYTLPPSMFRDIGQGYTPIIIFVVICVVFHLILSKTKFGRYIYAVGGNDKAAAASGVKVKPLIVKVYVISGILSGIAGLILTARTNSGQPAVGTGYEIDVIAAVVIGGTSMTGGIGTIYGTFIGMIIIGTLENGMNLIGVSSYWQQIIKGSIILITVVLDTYARERFQTTVKNTILQEERTVTK
ncbi:MAG: ABC transporter permease [Clostridiales bacterium]|nr:ABC transporter permease [Clostridiales bacterium]